MCPRTWANWRLRGVGCAQPSPGRPPQACFVSQRGCSLPPHLLGPSVVGFPPAEYFWSRFWSESLERASFPLLGICCIVWLYLWPLPTMAVNPGHWWGVEHPQPMLPTFLFSSSCHLVGRRQRSLMCFWGRRGIPKSWWLEVSGLWIFSLRPQPQFFPLSHLLFVKSWICQFLIWPKFYLLFHYRTIILFLTFCGSCRGAKRPLIHIARSCDARRRPPSCAFALYQKCPCGQWLQGDWSHRPGWRGPRKIQPNLSCARARLFCWRCGERICWRLLADHCQGIIGWRIAPDPQSGCRVLWWAGPLLCRPGLLFQHWFSESVPWGCLHSRRSSLSRTLSPWQNHDYHPSPCGVLVWARLEEEFGVR